MKWCSKEIMSLLNIRISEIVPMEYKKFDIVIDLLKRGRYETVK